MNLRFIGQLILFIVIAAAIASKSIAAPVEVPDTMAERVKACTVCHGLENRIGRDAYYPRIAGKPEGYLFNQLRNFRDGRRYYRPMALLLANVTDQYLLEMARYFSELKKPYPPPERLVSSPKEIQLAQKLVKEGDAERKIPACVECHGKELMGTVPFIPGLLGLPRVYIAAQFGAWKNGGLIRGHTADCMSEIAKRLTTEETNAVATWLAAQPVPENAGPAAALSEEMANRCGSIVLGGHSVIATHATDTSAGKEGSPALEQRRARGAYLARAANCVGCHTAQGGRPYAGGRSLSTPFGTFVTPNISPDKATGLGYWSEDDFWKALHEGKSRDGRLLYPAFPYTEYTKITREDADAIFAHLRSLAPVAQQNPPSRINPPYNFEPLLSLWRTVYFKPGVFQPDRGKTTEWNRGAYLVQGLGHCSACHAERNPLGGMVGATGAKRDDTLGGGQIMGSNWYAPSLTSSQEAGSAGWPVGEIVQLLTTGVSPRATTSGPMAEVVSQSLQHLTKDDARAMAVYLKSLPESNSRPRTAGPALTEQVQNWLQQGAKLYKEHCQDCHGSSGEGAPGIYPPLAGNRSVTMTPPINTIRSVLNGGYPPSTAGNPRPYGMPPFAQTLRDAEVALVLSYIRNAWGNRGSLVTTSQVDKSREGIH